MNVLFVIADFFYSEPLGVMQLSAILKKRGINTKLNILKTDSLIDQVKAFNPQIVAYNTLSPDIDLFKKHDDLLKKYMSDTKKHIIRIMGGPHPTFFQDILKEMELDAICVGEGDNAIVEIVNRVEKNENLNNIKNIMTKNNDNFEKELISDLDKLPFLDRDILYDNYPDYKSIAIRSVIASRGCPYNCTYCFNHAYNKMFQSCGKILRRRSVDCLIEELKFIVKFYQPVKIIRFGDDTFVYNVDDWLIEFVKRYRNEINIPFYCLMRSNTLTEDVARLLSEAGCKSVSMSIETGDERIRNEILKRNLSDEVVRESFKIAKKYKISVHANSMLGLPGSTLEHDIKTIFFAKELKPTTPSFGIFSPYPGTELTNYAIKQGFLEPNYNQFKVFLEKSPLNCYTEKEKEIQIRLAYLGTLFCLLPNTFNFLLYKISEITV